MKNLKYLSALLLSSILVITGCGKKATGDADERLEKALKNLSELESVSISAKLDAKMKSDDEDVDIDAEINAKLSGNKKGTEGKAYISADLDVLDYAIGAEAYFVYDEENTSLYFMAEDLIDWSVLSYENDDLEDEYGIDTEEIKDKDIDVKNFKKISEVKSDEKGLTKIKAVISSEELNDAESEAEFEFNSDLVIYFYINSKDQIEKIKIDLIDLFEDIDEVEVSKFDLTIELSNFNKTKVEVPKKVENDALKMDLEDVVEQLSSLMDLNQGTNVVVPNNNEYTAEDILEDIMLSASMSCNDEKFSVDFSNYNDDLYWLDDEYDVSRVTKGIVEYDEDCNFNITTDFVIDGKTCSYNDSLSQATCK